MATTTEQLAAPTLERLDRLARLEHDWDSYGGDPPTATALDRARHVVQDAYRALTNRGHSQAEPRVVVARGDGGILLEWNGARNALEVHIEPNGEIGYLLDESEQDEAKYIESDRATWSEIERLLILLHAA